MVIAGIHRSLAALSVATFAFNTIRAKSNSLFAAHRDTDVAGMMLRQWRGLNIPYHAATGMHFLGNE